VGTVALAVCGCLYDLRQDSVPDSSVCPGDIRCGACQDTTPCRACPDASTPDAKVKTDAPVVKSLVDDTFNDFKQGTLSESGAKIYVSAKGNVQLLDRLDLNGDGWLDLVFANHHDDTTFFVNSYIYWGSSTGFSATNRKELPTMGALSSVVADFDDDGYVDIFFGNYRTESAYVTNSFIYWGSAAGYSKSDRLELPTMGAISGQAADLDRDGHLDLVVVNHFGTTWKTDSYIYWGSASGFSAAKKSSLPTLGGHGLSIADLDRDGRLDLVFSNAYTKAKAKPNSYIYWGSSSGYSKSNRLELPTWGPFGNSVADVNADGHLDIVFSGRYDEVTTVNSYIYWGTPSGFKVNNRTALPMQAAVDTSVADLDGDKHLDIVFSNSTCKSSHKCNSTIYWGTASGISASKKTGLATEGAYGTLAADLDRDGFLDIVFASNYITKTHKLNSLVYWGAKGGIFNKKAPTGLPTLGPGFVVASDPGSVYDRKPVQTFTSRVLDSGQSLPTYKVLSWKATIPNSNTSLKLQLRSASSPVGLQSAPWHGPASKTDFYVVSQASTSATINGTHGGDRFIQYRATLSHDFGSTPVLDRVQISYSP